jgi:hypothetical protein
LTCINNGYQNWQFYLYQKVSPQHEEGKRFPLVWLASRYLVRPNDRCWFTWTVDYSFVWDAVGVLKPGVNFRGRGQQPCSVSGNNSTVFDFDPAPGLSVPTQGSPPDSLIIHDGSNIPPNEFSVGIGMGGSGIFVEQVGPRVVHYFTPMPNYWVAASNNTKAGDILDVETIALTAEVEFPTNIYDLTATLNGDNTWTISQTQCSYCTQSLSEDGELLSVRESSFS